MKRVYCYVRVSTAEQAKEGYSIDEQIDRLKSFCKSFDWIILKVFTDAGYSGGNTDRPALREMIRNIKKCDAVVVYKLDRLSRSQKDTLELIEDHFLANGVDFVSMCENFDTSTPFGRAMIGILAVFAQLEREQIKERMSMGKEGRAKEGKFHGGGNVPVGYDYADGLLSINEFEAMQIRMIYDLYSSGHTFAEIDRIFLQKGFRHKHGEWTSKRIRETMLNPLNYGMIKHNDKLFPGEHEPIVSKEQFDECKRIYDSKDHTVRNHGRSSYLGGLLFCKRCSARYSFEAHKDRGRVYRYYSCNSRRKQVRSMIRDPNCKNKIYRQEDLDQIIFDEIRKLALDPSVIHEMKSDDSSDIIKKEISKIDSQRSRLIDLYACGGFSAEELSEKVHSLTEQRNRLENELHALTARMNEDDAVKVITSFADVLETGDFDTIRMVINALISRIEIDGDDITIYWNFV